MLGVMLRALRTRRLDLVPVVPELADEMFAGLQANEIYAYIPDSPPATVEWLRARYARLSTGASPDGREAWLNWILRARDGHKLLGYVQATVVGDRASIAYVLFPSSWGMGFASEAVAALVDELRRHSIARLVATVDTRNSRSIAVLERQGFTRGAARDAEVIDGVRTVEYEYVRVLSRD